MKGRMSTCEQVTIVRVSAGTMLLWREGREAETHTHTHTDRQTDRQTDEEERERERERESKAHN